MSQLAKTPEATLDPFALPPLEPSPDGALQATVQCRTTRTGRSRLHHRITIETDWSVRTPHDIALERIATAMGGYLSCVDLVDREVPALCELVQLRARRALPQITRNTDGRWTLRAVTPQCRCTHGEFDIAAEAAEHARDPHHVARRHGVMPRRLAHLHTAITRAHGTACYLPPDDDCGAGRTVRERDGVAQLWEAGVHPLVVAPLHEALWPGGPPMPVWFYLGAVSRRPDLAWVADTLAAVPDEDVAVWLCWTDTELDRTHPEARTAWLRAGVPRRAIVALADGAYTPSTSRSWLLGRGAASRAPRSRSPRGTEPAATRRRRTLRCSTGRTSTRGTSRRSARSTGCGIGSAMRERARPAPKSA